MKETMIDTSTWLEERISDKFFGGIYIKYTFQVRRLTLSRLVSQCGHHNIRMSDILGRCGPRWWSGLALPSHGHLRHVLPYVN
jgi:hypothetical protein